MQCRGIKLLTEHIFLGLPFNALYFLAENKDFSKPIMLLFLLLILHKCIIIYSWKIFHIMLNITVYVQHSKIQLKRIDVIKVRRNTKCMKVKLLRTYINIIYFYISFKLNLEFKSKCFSQIIVLVIFWDWNKTFPFRTKRVNVFYIF